MTLTKRDQTKIDKKIDEKLVVLNDIKKDLQELSSKISLSDDESKKQVESINRKLTALDESIARNNEETTSLCLHVQKREQQAKQMFYWLLGIIGTFIVTNWSAIINILYAVTGLFK